jgi:hypothetical protein
MVDTHVSKVVHPFTCCWPWDIRQNFPCYKKSFCIGVKCLGEEPLIRNQSIFNFLRHCPKYPNWLYCNNYFKYKVFIIYFLNLIILCKSMRICNIIWPHRAGVNGITHTGAEAVEPSDCGQEPLKSRSKINPSLRCFVTMTKSDWHSGKITKTVLDGMFWIWHFKQTASFPENGGEQLANTILSTMIFLIQCNHSFFLSHELNQK